LYPPLAPGSFRKWVTVLLSPGFLVPFRVLRFFSSLFPLAGLNAACCFPPFPGFKIKSGATLLAAAPSSVRPMLQETRVSSSEPAGFPLPSVTPICRRNSPLVLFDVHAIFFPSTYPSSTLIFIGRGEIVRLLSPLDFSLQSGFPPLSISSAPE